jgi:CDGSH-type Zn-finger protein
MVKNAEGKVVVSKDGPYLVSGSLPLAKDIVVTGGDGDPEKWKSGGSFPSRKNYALCRCGQSKDKPYCDGAHARIGFDGTETASRRKYGEQAGTVKGPNLLLTDAQSLCSGAGFCHRAGGAWNLTRKSEDQKCKKTAIQEACDCPSGRLVAWDRKTNKQIEPRFRKSLGIIQDPDAGVSGPIWVKGGVQIESAGSRKYEVRNRCTLCRCGESNNKPFCDGTHIHTGFNDGDKPVKKK